MNRLWTAVVLCGLALGGAMSTQGGLGQGRTSETAAVIITSVVDGDTVRVDDRDGRDLGRIRLLGINAPELAHDGISAQCWAEQARARLAELTPIGATVHLVADPTQVDRDNYGRLLRYLLVGQVRAFWPKSPGLHAANYLAAAQQAEHDQRGLWASCTNRKDPS